LFINQVAHERTSSRCLLSVETLGMRRNSKNSVSWGDIFFKKLEDAPWLIGVGTVYFGSFGDLQDECVDLRLNRASVGFAFIEAGL